MSVKSNRLSANARAHYGIFAAPISPSKRNTLGGNMYVTLEALCLSQSAVSVSKADFDLATVYDSYTYFTTPISADARTNWLTAAYDPNHRRRRHPAVQAIFDIAISSMHTHPIASDH